MEEVKFEKAHTIKVGLMTIALPKQTAVSLSGVGINTDNATKICDTLKDHPHCTALDLGKCELLDDSSAIVLKHLGAESCRLKHLKLDNNGITDEGLKSGLFNEMLENNFVLQNLDLSSNSIGKNGAVLLAKGIFNNTTLKSIDLSSNEQIGDFGGQNIFQALKSNSALTSLSMNKCGLKTKAFKKLVGLLKSEGSILNSISVAQNELEGIVAVPLAESLKRNVQLQSLNLSVSKKLGHFGVVAIMESLTVNETLTELALSGNDISGSPLNEIAAALKSNASLKSLKMANMSIDDAGSSLIVDALADTKIEKLDLSYNDVEPPTCKKLQDYIVLKSCTLIELDLSNNSLHDHGARLLATGMEQNESIETLNLASNGIGVSGATVFAESLTLNHTLKHLDMTENQDMGKALVSFSFLLDRNKTLVEVKLTTRVAGAIQKKLQKNNAEKRERAKDAVLNAIAQLDKVQWNRAKLMLVGEEDAGKSTLLKALLGEPFRNSQRNKQRRGFKALKSVLVKDKNSSSLDKSWTVNEERPSGLDEILLRAGASQMRNGVDGDVVNEIRRTSTKQIKEVVSLKEEDIRNDEVDKVVMVEENVDNDSNDSMVIDEDAKEIQLGTSVTAAIRNISSTGPPNKAFNSILGSLRLSRFELVQALPRDEIDVQDQDLEEKPVKKKHKSRRKVRMSNVRYLMGSDNLDQRISASRLVKQVYNRDESKGSMPLNLMIWDYSGGASFHALHHLFISSGGVFIVVFNAAKAYKEICFVEEKQEEDPAFEASLHSMQTISWWLNMIKTHSSESPVLLVGTHAGLIKGRSQIKAVNSAIKNLELMKLGGVKVQKNSADKLVFFPVENHSGMKTLLKKKNKSTKSNSSILDLQDKIESTVRKLPTTHQKVPVRWIKCLDEVFKEDSNYFLTLDEVKELARNCGVKEDSEILEMLKLFNALGVVYYFSGSQTLTNFVTLNPQWLVDNVSQIMPLKGENDSDYHHLLSESSDKNVLNGLKEAKLEEDYKLFKEKYILSKALASYLWGKDESNFMLDFLERSMLISKWEFPVNVDQRPRMDLTQGSFSAIFSPESKNQVSSHFIVPDGPLSLVKQKATLAAKFVVFLDFSSSFLPRGVFSRIVSLAVAFSGTTAKTSDALIQVPDISRHRCFVELGEGLPVEFLLETEYPRIRISLPEENDDFGRSVYLALSFVHKVNADVMNESLLWDIKFWTKGNENKNDLTEAQEMPEFDPLFFNKKEGKKVGFEVEDYENSKADYYMFLEFL